MGIWSQKPDLEFLVVTIGKVQRINTAGVQRHSIAYEVKTWEFMSCCEKAVVGLFMLSTDC